MLLLLMRHAWYCLAEANQACLAAAMPVNLLLTLATVGDAAAVLQGTPPIDQTVAVLGPLAASVQVSLPPCACCALLRVSASPCRMLPAAVWPAAAPGAKPASTATGLTRLLA